MKTTETCNKFYHHRDRARKNGIGFELTYDQWLEIWFAALGPDWLSKRGRGKGKYVMARFGDAGPYAVGNVKIILFEENSKERKTSDKTREAARESMKRIRHLGKPHTPEARAKRAQTIKDKGINYSDVVRNGWETRRASQ